MNLKEQLASEQHEIWSHWMKYLFTCCELNADGSMTIPKDKVEQWQRQVTASYADLTEKEKESDREQADKILRVFVSEREKQEFT